MSLRPTQLFGNLSAPNLTAILTAVLLTGTLAAADTVMFRKSKIVDAKNIESNADLIFNRDAKVMTVRVADRVIANIPYSSIDKLSYEYSKKRRIKQGAVVRIASMGTGAVVMLTKSKSHWLYADFKQDGAAKNIVVKLDKKEYKDALATARKERGKSVENLADAGMGKAK